MRKFILFLLSFFCISVYLYSQEALKSTEESYYDLLALQGITDRPTLSYRTLSDSIWHIPEESDHIWSENQLGMKKNLWIPQEKKSNWFMSGLTQSINYKIFAPEWYNSYNSAAPYGQNDSAIWQGKGYNTYLTGGILFEGYGLSITFKPQISFSQNQEFEYTTPRYSGEKYKDKADTYGDYSLGSVDAPQRFGDKPIFKFDFGDSEIRYTWRTLTLGFGTENIWLGPAQENPIMHSNTAAGYAHLDFGMRKQKIIIKDIDFGDIEFRYWIGQTKESNYFDNDNTNNKNLLTGLSIAYAIPFLPGLSIGFNRTMLTKWEDRSAYSFFTLLIPFMKKKAGYDKSDQRASIYADYFIKKGGIDIYFEWGKNDYNSGFDNLMRYPFHTQAITSGFKKNVDYKKESLKGEFLFELTFIGTSMDYHFFYDWGGVGNDFYSHHLITQGYTHDGQYIGAGIGAGGNSQLVSYKLYYPKGNAGFFIQRVNPDLNYSYFLAYRDPDSTTPNDDIKSSIRVLFNIGIDTQYFIKHNFLISGRFIFSDEHNPLNTNKNIQEHSTIIKSEHRFNFITQIDFKYYF